MSNQRTCPRCRSAIPPSASACARCGAEEADGPRFSVVKAGEPFAAAAAGAAAPLVPTLPPDVLDIGEGDQVWYCRIGGQIIGPVTAPQIRSAFSKGQIDGQASVGIRGKQDWFPIRSLPQFSDLLTGIGPAPRPALASLPASAPRLPPRGEPDGPSPMGLPQASAPGPPGVPLEPISAGHELPSLPIKSPEREDKTEVVAPLPPPGPVPGAQVHEPGPSSGHSQSAAALLGEIRRLRRLVLILGVLAASLFIAMAALLGLVAAR